MKQIILAALICGGLSACSSAPAMTEPFYFIQGTHVGDPCSPNGMFIDTPRGYPRFCVKNRWVPLCEEKLSPHDRAVYCDVYQATPCPSEQE
jgi:hypothetical protein